MIINEIIVLFLKLLDEPMVCSIAANYNKSTAQVLLKWALQHDVGESEEPKSDRYQNFPDIVDVKQVLRWPDRGLGRKKIL